MKSIIAVAVLFFLTILPVSLFSQEELESKNTAAIRELLAQKKFAPARELVEKEIKRTDSLRQPPYASDGTLYLYAEPGDDATDLVETVLALKEVAPEERVDADWFAPLASLPGWTGVAAVRPYRPFLLFARAYLLVEAKNPAGAMQALEAAIALHPHYYPALAEKNHLLMLDGRFDEARDIAWAAIRDTYPQAERGKAVFFRNLGYIAIEEEELDEAVDFYNRSLELEPGHKGALGELEYIESLRKK